MKITPFAELTPVDIERSAQDFDVPAARAYAAYAASSNNKNFQGNPMPAWEALPPAIRGHWRAAVSVIVDSNAGSAAAES